MTTKKENSESKTLKFNLWPEPVKEGEPMQMWDEKFKEGEPMQMWNKKYKDGEPMDLWGCEKDE